MNPSQDVNWVRAGFVAALVFLLAVAVRWAGIGQEPLNDELFNYLAGRAWLNRDELAILPGSEPYDRNRLFTLALAQFMRFFGTSLEVARIPSVIAGALVAAGTTLWLNRRGMLAAGVVAGVLVALDPQLIQLSQLSRFYAVHVLAVFIGAVASLELLVSSRLRTMAFAGAIAVLCLGFAFQLQVTTIVPLAALSVFAFAWPESAIHRWVRRGFHSAPRLTTVALLLAAVAASVMFWWTGWFDRVVSLATGADAWAEGNRDNLRFYYAWLHDEYASIVVLFPLFALLAWVRERETTALALAIFGVAFVAHSVAAWKAPRFLSYALPFFFAVSAIGIVQAAKYLLSEIPNLIERAGGRGRLQRPIMVMAIGLVLASFTVGNRSILITSRLLTRDPAFHSPLMPAGETLSWSRAQPALDSILGDSVLLVSSNAGKAVFYFDQLDYILAGRRSEHEEFRIDERFDRPIVGTPESLRRIRCEGQAVVVLERHILARSRFPRATEEYLAREAAAIELSPATGLYAAKLNQPPDSVCAAHSD